MSSKAKADLAAYITINSTRVCSLKECHKHRRRASRWCLYHEHHALLYGHPLAGGIDRMVLKGHRADFEDFIRGHRNTEQVRAATQVCEAMIQHGIPDDGRPSKYRKSKYERFNVGGRIRDLRDQRVSGQEVLAAAGGAWLLSHYEPKILPDDVRLDYRMGIQVINLRPVGWRLQANGKREKRDVVGGYPRRCIGQHLRRHLAVFFTRVVQGLADEVQFKLDAEATLATPFDPSHDATSPPTLTEG